MLADLYLIAMVLGTWGSGAMLFGWINTYMSIRYPKAVAEWDRSFPPLKDWAFCWPLFLPFTILGVLVYYTFKGPYYLWERVNIKISEYAENKK